MRTRWPFAAALIAAVLVAGATLTALRWQAWQDGTEKRRLTIEFRQAQPAADVLDRVVLPAGMGQDNCPGVPDGSIATTHWICWRGDADVVPTTVALAKNLRAIGATEVSPRCLHHKFSGGSGVEMCDLTAHLHGQLVFATLGPDPDKLGPTFRTHGVTVFGGLSAHGWLSILGGKATPLPAPNGR